jgi:hypothetical protein
MDAELSLLEIWWLAAHQLFMMKPVVAVDLDEVLGHFVPQLAQFHNHHHGTELTAASFSSCKAYFFSKHTLKR